MPVRVLLVDDDEALATTVGRFFRAAGHSVVVAPDAVLALTRARQDSPDVIILDIGLPAGRGTTVLQRLRSLNIAPFASVVVVSGGLSADEWALLEEEGVTAILYKPVALTDLLGAVEKAYAASAVPPAGAAS